MVKDITVYSRPTCAPCKMLKTWLAHKGIAYHDINIDDDPAAQRQAIEISGYSIVPLTVVTRVDGSQSIVTGYNLSQLAALV